MWRRKQRTAHINVNKAASLDFIVYLGCLHLVTGRRHAVRSKIYMSLRGRAQCDTQGDPPKDDLIPAPQEDDKQGGDDGGRSQGGDRRVQGRSDGGRCQGEDRRDLEQEEPGGTQAAAMMVAHGGAYRGRSHGGGRADDSRGSTAGGRAGGGGARGGDREPTSQGEAEDLEGQGRAGGFWAPLSTVRCDLQDTSTHSMKAVRLSRGPSPDNCARVVVFSPAK
ncbi:hypothetical protein H4Q32_027011 [Labeo rohita]|uniref:Uncharacterized protein n=1 Tax=Labeo rohita TaxID=84645 RepID=A0ABQ8L1S4_LABRO|nr:hypothetical protein H4Q32_027011 [Labeo rohita]